MKKCLFTHAEFLKSALAEKDFPTLILGHNPMPEIAFLGKSNVGKSSLLNHLINNKKLARVSSTPGKTQLLNFFVVDEQLMLVDVPGYGYAKVPTPVKKQWSNSLENYFQKRKNLSLVLLLLDIRRLPSEDDLIMARWAAFHKKKLLIVFTKTDKVNELEKKNNTEASLTLLSQIDNLSSTPYLHYSIQDRKARELLIEKIQNLLE